MLAEHLVDSSQQCYPIWVISIGFSAHPAALAPAPLSALPPPPPQYAMLAVRYPSTKLLFVGYANVLASYQILKKLAAVESSPAAAATSPAPSPLHHRTRTTTGDSDGLGNGNALPVQDAMLASWSVDLAKRYLHLPWGLLNKPTQVEVLMAPDIVLTAPVSMRLLQPDMAQWALEFIANGTIQISPIEKFLSDGEPSSPAVNTIC
uniref:Uncharacterized protein n=1 Tax=Romanomermis culicivorax TaxID=13658 RepID=A0A915HSU3_ROMCU